MADKLSNDILRTLKDHKEIITANKFNARGTSFMEHLDIRQMDVLTVLVDATKADDLFDFLYHAAQINRPHGGMIFQEKVGRSTDYTLPKL